MEIKRYIINENEYSFVCECWSNSRAWGHRVVLIKNIYTMCEAKMTYINRTWENYRFQTCMLKAIYLVKEKEQAYELECYKAKTGKKRLKKAEKQEVYANCKQLQELEELEKKVKGRVW